ncbi:MAG TPA: ABC transporter substrate-binding protein [Caulobacteraceae bacterium]
MGGFRALAAVVLAAVLAGPAAGAPIRVFSLDQCADQYVLALSPRAAIVGLSPRVGDADSYLRAQSTGLPRRRASPEAILAARPDVVVRYWGGDPALVRAIERRGAQVVQIDEATDFAGLRSNLKRVAAALHQDARGAALIRRMDAQIPLRAAGPVKGALYLTPGEVTGGPGTLIDAILTAAGFRNLAPGPGYQTVSIERLVLDPPDAFVLGFFDSAYLAGQHWSVGANHVLRSLVRDRTVSSLNDSLLGCPAWFAGDAVQALAAARGRR